MSDAMFGPEESGFVIARMIDCLAVMEGSDACHVRWGQEVKRVRRYPDAESAHQSFRLLADWDDCAVVIPFGYWVQAIENIKKLEIFELGGGEVFELSTGRH